MLHDQVQNTHLGSQPCTTCLLTASGIFLTPPQTVLSIGQNCSLLQTDCTWNLYTSHQNGPVLRLWEKMRGSIPSQTVSSFIKDTFHKQSWYFRQDMGRQSLTVYNNFKLPSSMNYQNQKATIKPSEVFIGCSEEEKFRVRADISHWGCCLTTFPKPTLTFGKWSENGREHQSVDPQSEKEPLLFWGRPSQ